MMDLTETEKEQLLHDIHSIANDLGCGLLIVAAALVLVAATIWVVGAP